MKRTGPRPRPWWRWWPQWTGSRASGSTPIGDERVTIVRFRDWASHRAWAEHPEHREAQRRGIEEFYDFYELSVGEDAVHHVFDKMDQ